MSTSRTIARNALWNWAGMTTHMLAGFVVAPFLVGQLGQTGYGLWILIASLTSYFCVLDLGVSGSVGRNVAFLRAKNDRDGVNRLVSTALAILSGVAALCVIATLGAVALFFLLFDVAADQVDAARIALLLVGLNLAMSFVFGVFDGVLWGLQRFDLQNIIDIPATLARAALTFLLIGNGYGLVALALITLLTTLATGLAKTLLCFWLEPGLRVRPGLVRKDAAGYLYGYGIWYFLLSLARTITPQISPQVIGARLAVALVTPFSVAMRLVGYGNAFLIAGTQVLTPVATGLHAAEQHAKQRTLFLEGGKYCLALGLFFVTLFICLGQPLLDLWMGPALRGAWPLLIILALGELLAMSQWITYSMILGMSRHKVTACFNMFEAVLILGLALALAEPYGLIGVALAVAVPGAICRGLAPLLYGCRLVQVPVGAYLLRAFAPPLLVAAGPALLLGLAVAWHAPRTWPELVGYTAVFSAMYFVLCAFAVVGRQRIARLLPRLRRPSPPLPANPPAADTPRTAITEHGPEGVLAS